MFWTCVAHIDYWYMLCSSDVQMIPLPFILLCFHCGSITISYLPLKHPSLTLYSAPHWESQDILPSWVGRQAVVPNHSPPHQLHCLLCLPPFFSTSPSSAVVETDFPEGRRGRLRWWICSAEACLPDPTAWKTWLASGVVQGTYREAHNRELCLCLALNLCVVSLLTFTQWCYTWWHVQIICI